MQINPSKYQKFMKYKQTNISMKRQRSSIWIKKSAKYYLLETQYNNKDREWRKAKDEKRQTMKNKEKESLYSLYDSNIIRNKH